MTAENRDKVVAYYKLLWSGDVDRAMADNLSGSYVEHQYLAGFTRDGMRDHVVSRRAAHPEHQMIVHHVLSDKDHVFLLAEEKLGDNVDYARAELFRIEDGRIAEHWGGHVLDDKNRKNPHGTFDGPQVDRSTDYAARYGEAFEAKDKRGFDGEELHLFHETRPANYIQHSPKGGDGLIGLTVILEKAKNDGIKVSMTRFRTLTDGDFLLSHRLYDSNPTHPLMNRIYTFDIFRIDAEGRAVEHWDVMDPVPEKAMLEKM